MVELLRKRRSRDQPLDSVTSRPTAQVSQASTEPHSVQAPSCTTTQSTSAASDTHCAGGRPKAVFNRLIRSFLVDKATARRPMERAPESKGTCPPSGFRRGTEGSASRRPDSMLNVPSCAHPARDDRLSGARPFCRSRAPASLTGPRPACPASKGGFCMRWQG